MKYKALQPTREQKRAQWLSSMRVEQVWAGIRFMGRLQDTFHPITLSDGTYWRQGRWNRLPKV